MFIFADAIVLEIGVPDHDGILVPTLTEAFKFP